MNIKNDQITFEASDFSGLSEVAKRAIEHRMGSLEDFAREQGTIMTRSLDADKARLRQVVAQDPQVVALIEKLSLMDEPDRADAVAEAIARD